MKFHVAVFEFQSTINNGSAKRSPCRGEFLTISLWLTIYIYIYYFAIMGRRLNRWTRGWMRMTRIRWEERRREGEKKGGLCGNRNNAEVLEKMKIPRLEVIGIFHDGEFAVCSCDESYRVHRRDWLSDSRASLGIRARWMDGISCANERRRIAIFFYEVINSSNRRWLPRFE